MRAAALLAAALSLAACAPEPPTKRISGHTMGTTWQATIASDQPLDAAALQADLQSLLDAQNHLYSTWRKDSHISRLNAAPDGVWLDVHPQLYELLQLALDISTATDGAFDITVGGVARSLGFGPPPSPERAANPPKPDHRALQLQDGQVRKARPLELDLSAIAKGHAVDKMSELLVALGHPHHLVEIGGELRASGHRRGRKPWRLAIEQPAAGRAIHRTLHLTDAAIATSGDYRNCHSIDAASTTGASTHSATSSTEDGGDIATAVAISQGNRRICHSIDPRLGLPSRSATVSATVIAPRAAVADAIATACMVLPPSRCIGLAERDQWPVYLMVLPPGLADATPEVLYSTAFAPHLQSASAPQPHQPQPQPESQP